MTRTVELPVSTRLLVRGAAAADLALRTAVASAITVPFAFSAVRASPRRELEQLAFYRELAQEHDPALAFPVPRTPVRVEELDPPRLTFAAPGGTVRMLRFQSPFQAVNPAVRRRYDAHRENRVAWAQHWRHDDGPRPTLAVIHGFGASPFWLNSAFFSLPWLYRQGYDVLMYLLPFHGVRQAHLAPFNGWGLFAHGLAHFNEAMAHGVHDFRLFHDHLREQGVEQVAITGLSLGGYMAALLASVDRRAAIVIPNAPVVDLGALIRQWFPANLTLAGITCLAGLDHAELEAALAVHCPLNYEPLVPHERRMIIGGLGDRLAPPEQARWLWEHWDRPRLHWFPGNHVLHAGRGVYLKEMVAFMRANGFASEQSASQAGS